MKKQNVVAIKTCTTAGSVFRIKRVESTLEGNLAARPATVSGRIEESLSNLEARRCNDQEFPSQQGRNNNTLAISLRMLGVGALEDAKI